MRREILASGVAVGLLRLVGMGLGLLVTIVIGRALGPEGLGTYGYAVIVLSLLAVPVSYGWAAIMLRRVAAALHDASWEEPKAMLLRGTQFAAGVALLCFVVALLLAWQTRVMPTSMGWFALVALAAVLFMDQVSALRLAMLRGLNHPIWGQVPETLVRPTLIVVLFGFAWATLGAGVTLDHAFGAMALAAFAALVAGAIVLWRKGPEPLWQAIPRFRTREWLASATLLAGNSALVLLNSYADILMLGVLGSMEQVGIYRIATQIALLSGFVYTALNMLAAPRFAYLRTAGKLEELRHAAVFMARLALLGTIPLPLVFAFFGPAILTAVFGPAFAAAADPMMPLFVGQAVNAAVGMASSLLIVGGKESRLIVFTAAAVAVNVVLSALLIPRMGAMGAAVANMSAMIVWNLSIWIFALRTMRIDTSIFGWLKP